MLSRFLVTLRLLATHGCLAFGSVGAVFHRPTPPNHSAKYPAPKRGAPRFLVTLALGAWPGRFPSELEQNPPLSGGWAFVLASVQATYAPALALLYTQFALLELFP